MAKRRQSAHTREKTKSGWSEYSVAHIRKIRRSISVGRREIGMSELWTLRMARIWCQSRDILPYACSRAFPTCPRSLRPERSPSYSIRSISLDKWQIKGVSQCANITFAGSPHENFSATLPFEMIERGQIHTIDAARDGHGEENFTLRKRPCGLG